MPLPIHSYRSFGQNRTTWGRRLPPFSPESHAWSKRREPDGTGRRGLRLLRARRHAHTPPPADSWAPLPSLSIPVSLVHVSRAHRLLPAAARIESRPSRAPRDGRRLIPTVHVQVPWDPRQGTHPPVLPVSRIRAMYCRSDGCPPLPGAI